MLKKVFPKCGLWMCFIVVLCSAPFIVTAAPLYSAPVKLGWSPAADLSVKGYVVYYGLANQVATNQIVVGTNLSVTVTNMLANTTYKLFAASYNAANVESPPSNQLLITPPVIGSINLTCQTNRSMKLDCRAAAGTVCGVQFSPTMLPGSWRTLTNVLADALGNIIANDASASRVTKRFYRLVLDAQPLLSAMQIYALTNGSMQLSFTAPPDSRCRIQFKNKPTSTIWSTLADVTADAEGNVVVIDTSVAQSSTRVYQALLL